MIRRCSIIGYHKAKRSERTLLGIVEVAGAFDVGVEDSLQSFQSCVGLLDLTVPFRRLGLAPSILSPLLCPSRLLFFFFKVDVGCRLGLAGVGFAGPV